MQTNERVETIVSLPKDLLEQANEINKNEQISDVIEVALRDYLAKKHHQQVSNRDIEILNANAEKLNEEALDVLEYQEVNW